MNITTKTKKHSSHLSKGQLLHPRNRHNSEKGSSYQFDELCKANPALKPFVIENSNRQTIEFANPDAVKQLNTALLLAYYDLKLWQIPDSNLCPPIPGRADYIHFLADLLAESNGGEIPKGKSYTGIDIGTGASLIYPIIGVKEYGWKFVATDIEKQSIQCAKLIVSANNAIKKHVSVVLQPDTNAILNGVIKQNTQYLFTMCNPPFFRSAEEARQANARKTTNLNIKPTHNFSGQNNELFCEGGETEFVCKMLDESSHYSEQVLWFTSLVSNKKNLNAIQSKAKTLAIKDFRIIEMEQGNKISRFVAWSYLNQHQQREWFNVSR